MAGVVFDREWHIHSKEDFDQAIAILNEDAFIAEMSDCYAVTCSEKAEIARQRLEVYRQAKENAAVWFFLTEEKQAAILELIPGDSEHGKCIGYRQEAYHDVHTFEDGHEERLYIGD